MAARTPTAEPLPVLRLVSWPELHARLYPLVQDWPWGEDTIRDLWLLGAPVPQDRCPRGIPCNEHPNCEHIRRVLIPEMLAKWWEEVAERQGNAMGAHQLTERLGKSH